MEGLFARQHLPLLLKCKHSPQQAGLQKNTQHPLRERAKKLDQGILVIRFEMPFNVWCTGCGHLIGKGVRFNAEKQAIGTYHSTKILSFSMTAPCCQQRIVVHTDPKAAEYRVVSGGRRKVRHWLPLRYYVQKTCIMKHITAPTSCPSAWQCPAASCMRQPACMRCPPRQRTCLLALGGISPTGPCDTPLWPSAIHVPSLLSSCPMPTA